MDWSMFADPGVLSDLTLQGLVRGSMYALMGLGLSIIFGILDIVNFAHGELFMIGSYVMYYAIAVLGLPFPVGVAAAAVVVFVVGVLIERGLVEPLRKRAGREWLMDAFVLTIGLMVILQNAAQILFSAERLGVAQLIPGDLSFGEIDVSFERLAILAIAVLVVALLWAFVKFTRIGKAIRATAQNAEAAQTLGIDVNRIYTVAFGIGAALAGMSGALLISIYPAYPTVGADPVLKSFAVVIIGGLGNVSGAIAAGLLLGVIEAYTFFLMSAGWQNVLTAALVVAIMIVKPSGLFAPKGARP
ncbi:MAG TPA: branched-chain amino acid ABC transporter permease [Alphaproteobacteria bacterium]|nr:branched-chain amino acid ABC transporter permease [Alphaproteobacteria bacterium]